MEELLCLSGIKFGELGLELGGDHDEVGSLFLGSLRDRDGRAGGGLVAHLVLVDVGDEDHGLGGQELGLGHARRLLLAEGDAAGWLPLVQTFAHLCQARDFGLHRS